MKWLGIIVLCSAILIGCATTRSVMESWVGHRESELVSNWGAPYAAIDTRDGKRILTWQFYWGQYRENICRKSFTIDENGIIRQWSYSGCLF
jgi:hypothetical protein